MLEAAKKVQITEIVFCASACEDIEVTSVLPEGRQPVVFLGLSA